MPDIRSQEKWLLTSCPRFECACKRDRKGDRDKRAEEMATGGPIPVTPGSGNRGKPGETVPCTGGFRCCRHLAEKSTADLQRSSGKVVEGKDRRRAMAFHKAMIRPRARMAGVALFTSPSAVLAQAGKMTPVEFAVLS